MLLSIGTVYGLWTNNVLILERSNGLLKMEIVCVRIGFKVKTTVFQCKIQGLFFEENIHLFLRIMSS